MKRIFTLLIVATMFAISSLAYDVQIDGIYYNLNNETKTATVTHDGKYNDSNNAGYNISEITISSKITYRDKEYDVTLIGDQAFWGCSSLTSITIPNGVTTIGERAFSLCESLSSIVLPNSITSIGEAAFSSTPWLKNRPNHDGCIYINNCLYQYKDEMTTNTHINIKDGTTQICSGAFMYCSLTSITIPNSVKSIGNFTFAGCSSLTSITIPNGVTTIGERAFAGCESLSSIIIGNNVTSIGIYAFENSTDLISITCLGLTPPNAIDLDIDHNQCTLFVPKGSLNDYQNHAEWGKFSNIQELEGEKYTITITVNDDAMGSIIGGGEYEKDSEITLTATANDGYRFVKWSDGNIENPRTITVTEDITLTAEFANDIIASGTCGDNLTWQLTFDSVLTISGTGVMYDYTSTTQPWNSYKQQIKTININDGVTSIGNYAFSSCSSLTSITIPNSVTSIGYSAFSHCSSLTSITIPNSVTSIGEGTFYECSSLTSIDVKTNNQNYASIDGVLYNKEITTLICCPGGKTSITIPNSVTSIGDYAFYGCKSLKSITIPNSVTSIENEAFYLCKSLKYITIGNGVTSIGDYAFYGCLSLNTIKCLGFTPPSANALGADIENCTLKVPSEAYNNYLQHAYWGQFLDKELLIKTNPTIINKGYNGEIIILYNPFAGNEGMIDAMECYAHTGLITMESSSFSEWRYCHSEWRAGEDKYKMTKEGDFWKLVIPNIYEYYECPESEEIIKLVFVFNDGPNGYKEGKTANGSDILINLVESTIEQYEIIVTSNENGNVIGGGFYNENKEVILTANPNEGYRFTQWSDGNTENPRTIIVTQDSTFTAIFELEEYALYATSASPELGYVKHTIEAIAIEGFEFDGWSDGNTDNPRTIVLTEDTKLYAYFRMAQGGNPVDLETSKISSANIYTTNGTLHIEGATDDYHILDAAGRLIYSGNATTLQLPRGIYLITMGGEVEKIVL